MSDQIRREDAIATIGVMYERCDTHDIIGYRDLMLEAVKVLPSADRPQGEWVEVCKRTEQYDREGVKTWAVIYQCPTCGFVLNAIENHTAQYNYCPSCGCRMKGASR